MKKRKPKTSPKQLARVRDWEKRNPERAQARKDAWAQSPAGKAWLKANQKKKNAARDAWRQQKMKEMAPAKQAEAARKRQAAKNLKADIARWRLAEKAARKDARRRPQNADVSHGRAQP